MKRADLILHPVRLRIILAFSGGRRLTPQQVAGALPDVPQATLYRQIERLFRGGALAIAAERRVRGAVERTYVLAEGASSVSPEDLAKSSRDDHLGYFTAFAAGLIAQFEQYLERPEIDFLKDGVGYREAVLNLIKRKAAGRRIDVAPSEEPAQADDDLTAALEASLSSAGR